MAVTAQLPQHLSLVCSHSTTMTHSSVMVRPHTNYWYVQICYFSASANPECPSTSIPTHHFHALHDAASCSTLPTAPVELAPHTSLICYSRSHIDLIKQHPNGQLGFKHLVTYLGRYQVFLMLIRVLCVVQKS